MCGHDRGDKSWMDSNGTTKWSSAADHTVFTKGGRAWLYAVRWTLAAIIKQKHNHILTSTNKQTHPLPPHAHTEVLIRFQTYGAWQKSRGKVRVSPSPNHLQEVEG